MKKDYESPKAEKMEFNYSDVVVASGSQKCDYFITYTQAYEGCRENKVKQWAEVI